MFVVIFPEPFLAASLPVEGIKAHVWWTYPILGWAVGILVPEWIRSSQPGSAKEGGLDRGKLWFAAGLSLGLLVAVSGLVDGLKADGHWLWFALGGGVGLASTWVAGQWNGWSKFWAAYVRPFSRIEIAALWIGIGGGFACATALAWQVARTANFKEFVRFHERMDQRSHFYPTVSMLVRHLELTVPEDKMLVLLGGHSVFQGVGQNADEVWTRDLQRLLGNRFVVVNYAMGSATIADFAGTVFRILAPRRRNLLFVPATCPAAFQQIQGSDVYSYVAWDAYYQNVLPLTDQQRDKLQPFRDYEARNSRTADFHIDLRLNAFLRHRDLWNYAAYQSFGTIWDETLMGQMFRARRRLPERRFPYADLVRPQPGSGREDVDVGLLVELPSRLVRSAADGQVLAIPEAVQAMAEELDAVFPPDLRSRMLICLTAYNPRFLQFLTPAERAANDAAFRAYAETLGAHGIATVVLGDGLPGECYLDQLHLLPEGGRRLAAELAPAIRDLARRNGFAE